MILNAVSGVVMTALSLALARILAGIFVSGDKELLDLTTDAMRIYGISFIFVG